jgi:nucleotide-binding universal stress UspA family protein
MLSAWRDIAVFVDETEAGDQIARQAAVVARQHQSHLVGIFGVAREPSHPSEGFTRGEQGIRDLIAKRRHEDAVRALAAGRQFSDLLRDYDVGTEFRVVRRGETAYDVVLNGLNCDLIVVSHPKLDHLPESWSGEHLLLVTGAPVLRIPRAWDDRPVGKNVLIAWNGSREVRRAVNDSMPLLGSADTVTVLTVDGDRTPELIGSTADDVLRHLSRHDVDAHVASIQSEGRPVAEAILGHAASISADLLVIGAYSHPRTMERLFGGITRSLLNDAAIPLLLSR